MAPGRREIRAWRKEHDVGNRRVSATSSQDVAAPSGNVPFEELLARELRKSEGINTKTSVSTSSKVSKKPFLKKGARGWWMRQPDAKQKVVKHTLVSKGEEEKTISRTASVTQKRQPTQQQRRRRPSSASSSKTLSPVATPTQQIRTAPTPSQTLSPPVSPIRRKQYSNQVDNDVDEKLQRRQQNEDFASWKNASFRSTTSTDMGLRTVRQSYEAKQQREANEMAEFEAIERDLAAEKDAYLKEKQQQEDRQDQVDEMPS
ncbi:uncharacterized protein PITG_19884 [Phytophthora infestans T30-4]|uniref:Uncharacterized protein n=1 Tax=Phytophthora infestans (strain T30-4) TaxID=403677 RepID=D0P0P7_PHYIT|nr:uncharacterized protein PITG_19884 [Phytophthora infestans T30-4]EEY53014.1 conserved hypothetical protein [Phytophthora infestans T30-4]|eukprot:XP_002896142.1 conserved hypothetical protein [Phytophthora infestans T30-4]